MPPTDAPAPTAAPAAGRSDRRAQAEPVPYDFRRPIQLSREHSRMLQVAFDSFCRQATTAFTSGLRTVCTVTLTSIEQSSYAEYVDSLDSATYLTVFSAEPLANRCILEVPLQAMMVSLDHMLGGLGTSAQPDRPLTEIESTVATGLVERLLAELRYSFASVVTLEPVVTDVEYSPQLVQVASAADVMITVSLELKINDRTFRVTICLPFSDMHPHLMKAAAPVAVSDRERAQRAQAAAELRQQFTQVPVDVAVRLRPTALRPGDLAALSSGDVVRLNHPASAPLDVVVDGINFAHATAGTSGFRLAALIVGTPKENA